MVLAWILFAIYMLGTAYLGYLGHKQTKDFGSFAIGKGDMNPWVVGITLAASTASAATFIINPGFVYVDGLSAFMHLGVSVFIGFTGMLYILSFKFREIGAEVKALTIPDWIGKRYKSKSFSLYFAFLNLLSFAFIILLVGGISIVMQKLLGVSNFWALVITIVFVTGYVLFGGTYAHVFTNLFQGSLMAVISLLILVSGFVTLGFSPAFWSDLQAEDPNLLQIVNENSKLFNDYYSTIVAGLVIGAGLVCQPHILTKALYVKDDKTVGKYIGVFALFFFIFTMLLMVGFWAHGTIEPAQLTDSTTGAFRQDLVMTVYLQNAFPEWIFTVISVVLLAAAMSTLDGLLVGISTITANDLVLNLVEKFKPELQDQEEKMKIALRASHVVLVVLAVAAFAVSLNPPKLLGIFGQTGVYGLVLAAIPPLLAGVLFKNPGKILVWIFSVLALLIHFGLYFFGNKIFPDSGLAFANPGVTASIGLLCTALPVLIIEFSKKNKKEA